MSQIQSKRLPPSLFAAILIGLIVALGAAGFDQYFKTTYLEVGDIAVNALQIDNAKHFKEIYGNYSRFEFNHPGPAFFYVYSAGEWLLYNVLHVVPSPGNAHLCASMCLQSAFFALALALMAVHVPARVWLPLALVFAALYFGPLHDPFMSIWPPHVLLMPFLCFLVACCSVGTGRADHLPYAVLAGGFLFHGHVAQPLFVGSLGLLAVGLCLSQLRRSAPGKPLREWFVNYRKAGWICAALAALFALPLVIDVILGGTRSNVATIIGRFYANTGDSKTPLQSFLYFVSFATPAQNQDEIFTKMGPQVGEFFRPQFGRLFFWGIILIFTPALAFIWPSRLPADERRFLLTSHLFVLVTVLVCVFWGMAQAGPMMHFNGYFYYGIYFFGFLIALGWLDGLARRTAPAPLTSALCVIAAVAFTWSFRLPRWTDAEAGMPTKRAVDAALSKDGSIPKILVFEHKDWPAVAGVALDLQREGSNFYMAPWWGFMFGIQHRLTNLGEAPEDVTRVWWLTNPGEGGIPISPTLSVFTEPAPIRPTGDEIRFRGGDNGFRYVVSGVSAGNLNFTWTELPRVVLLFAPQTAEQDVRVTFDVQSASRDARGTKPQKGVILYNGQEIGRPVITDRTSIAFTIPRALWNRTPRGKLELRFPDAVLNRDYKRPRFDGWSAWGLWSIRFEPAS